jgi:hypothetical protein
LGAPGPHDFAVRICAARQSAQLASTAFRSTFVTIAIRPSHRCGMRKLDHEFRKYEIRLFLHAGLERSISLKRFAKFDSSRMHFPTVKAFAQGTGH